MNILTSRLPILAVAILITICPSFSQEKPDSKDVACPIMGEVRPGAKTLTYESETTERIGQWDASLREYAAKGDSCRLQMLKMAIDAESALADLRIKVRQADWAKLFTWFSLLLPFIGAIVGALIGARAAGRKPQPAEG